MTEYFRDLEPILRLWTAAVVVAVESGGNRERDVGNGTCQRQIFYEVDRGYDEFRIHRRVH